MSAIETCRTAVMGGHFKVCTNCGHWRVAYNSCRNRHCPRCQGAADLLPAEVAQVALQNKAAVYGLLFQVASETMTTVAADAKHLGARIGITAVLHTWGSAMTHHPHIHLIVPGGGLSADGSRWVSSRPAFLLAVRVLGRLFRRLFLTRLAALHDAGRIAFFGSLAHFAIGAPSCITCHRSGRSAGSSTPNRGSPGPRRCSPTFRATPTAWRSRTAGCCASTRLASPSATRTIAVPVPNGSRS